MAQPIKMLDVNKNVTFPSPLEDGLVRTGTIGDGSCFFHSALHATSQEYRLASENERRKIVKQIRKKYAGDMTPELWEKLGRGEIAKVVYSLYTRDIIDTFYQIVENTGEYVEYDEDDPVLAYIFKKMFVNRGVDQYRKLFDYISLRDFEMTLLPAVFDKKNESKRFGELLMMFKTNARRFLADKILSSGLITTPSELRSMFDSLNILVTESITIAFETAFEEYKDYLKDCSTWIDEKAIELTSDLLDRDIYVIDSQTRMPYSVGGCENYKGRTSIVILWLRGGHYEVLGRYMPNKTIQREFPADDPLIQKIYSHLCKQIILQ